MFGFAYSMKNRIVLVEKNPSFTSTDIAAQDQKQEWIKLKFDE